MHEFDQFVTSLLDEERSKELKSKPKPTAALTYKELNTKVRTLQNRVRQYNKSLEKGLPIPSITENLYKEALEQLPDLTRKRAEALKELNGPADSDKVRITFSRYADDWIIVNV